MKITKKISMLMISIILAVVASYADDFNPTNPKEPGGGKEYQLTLLANFPEGCSFSGQGKHEEGSKFTVYCNKSNGFEFVNWTDTKGNIVSEKYNYSYVMPAHNDTLIANLKFVGYNVPSEPSTTKAKHHVYISSDPVDAGSYSQTNGFQVEEGSKFSVNAYNNNNFTFVEWTCADTLVTTKSSLSMTMGESDIYITAHYKFDPKDPNDPTPSNKAVFSALGGTISLSPGFSGVFPVYVQNSTPISEAGFTITVPEGMTVNASDVVKGERAGDATVSATTNGNAITFTVKSDSGISDDNGVLLYIPIKVGKDVELNTYDVRISDAWVKEQTGNVLNASVRPGQIIVEENDLRIQSQDYASIQRMYEELGGNTWSKQWNVGSKVINSVNYPGLDFDAEGYVTTIDLTASGLKGDISKCQFDFPRLKTLSLASNALSGSLKGIADNMPQLTSLDLSYNLFSDVDTPIPATVTSFRLQGQHRNVNDDKKVLGLENSSAITFTIGKAPDESIMRSLTLATYNHTKGDYSFMPQLKLLNAANMSSVQSLDFATYPANGIKEGSVVNIPYDMDLYLVVGESQSFTAGSTLKARITYMMGDANMDGSCDVLDAQATLNYIMQSNKNSFNYPAANTFADNTINVQDIVKIINIFTSEPVMKAKAAEGNRSKAFSSPKNIISINNGQLILKASEPVAAIDMLVEGASEEDVRSMMDSRAFQFVTKMTEEGLRIVIFSPSRKVIEEGENVLAELPADASIAWVKTADVDANEIATDIDSYTTGIINSGISAQTAETMIYTTDGILIGKGEESINTLPRGMYIISKKRNGKMLDTRRVILK